LEDFFTTSWWRQTRHRTTAAIAAGAMAFAIVPPAYSDSSDDLREVRAQSQQWRYGPSRPAAAVVACIPISE
jgi:hypothetical protein